MAKVERWQDSLSYRNNGEIQEIEKALYVLSSWKLFEREFKLESLRLIVSQEVSKRRFEDPSGPIESIYNNGNITLKKGD